MFATAALLTTPLLTLNENVSSPMNPELGV
jgi:hypothetical protein